MAYDAILIDGRNLAHRARHGGKDLTTTIKGEEVAIGAVYQFIRSATLLFDEHAAPGCVFMVAWEGDRERSWRRDLFPEYKDRPVSGDLEDQLTLLKKVLIRCGWSQVWSPHHEADDTLATLARLLEGKGLKVGIVTGDHDLHQCVRERVHIIDPNAKRYDLVNGAWKVRDVLHQWGVDPSKVPDVKALAGDKSDGIPGATRIGRQWASAIVQAYDGPGLDAAVLDGELEVEIDGNTRKSKAKAKTLAEERERIELFRRLVTVVEDAPLEFSPRKYDGPKVRALFEGLRFSSLLAPSTLRTVARMAGQ